MCLRPRSMQIAIIALFLFAVLQPGGVPCFFVPEEYDEVTKRFARPVFFNQILREPHSSHLHALQLSSQPSAVEKTVNSVSAKRPHDRDQQQSEKHAQLNVVPKCVLMSSSKRGVEPRPKRRRSGQNFSLKGSMKSTDRASPPHGTTPATITPQRSSQGTVNLAWLRWEPYDTHMSPYEFAPTVG